MRTISMPRAVGALVFLLVIEGCYNRPAFLLNRDGNNYTHTYQWQFDGHMFEATFTVPCETYYHYRNLTKRLRYEEYAKEDSAYSYLLPFAAILYKNVARYRYGDDKLIQYLAKMVQTMPYRSDPPGLHEYPKYPVETLLEGGDCEDCAILLSTLLNVFFGSQKSVLILLPQHMVCGIRCIAHEGEYYYDYNNSKYYFCETTAVFPIGVLSVALEEASQFEIRPVPDVPRFAPKPPERKRYRKRKRVAACDIGHAMYTDSNSLSWFLSEELFNPLKPLI